MITFNVEVDLLMLRFQNRMVENNVTVQNNLSLRIISIRNILYFILYFMFNAQFFIFKFSFSIFHAQFFISFAVSVGIYRRWSLRHRLFQSRLQL